MNDFRRRPLAFGLAAGAMAIGHLASGPASAGSPALTIRPRHNAHGLPPRRPDGPPAAAPIVVPIDGTGVFVQTPFFDVMSPYGPEAVVRVPHYRGSDGAYDSLADLSNDIQGTPCGRECTARSLVRWGYLPAE